MLMTSFMPKSLAEGIHFFILHVEQYIPSISRARRSSSAGFLDNASAAPLESANTVVAETPLTAGERASGDYFSTVPKPHDLKGPGRPTAGVTVSPPETSGERSSLAMQRIGSTEGMPFTRVDTEYRRRPSSVASSSGSFRGGIHLGGSVKAGPTSAISRNLTATTPADLVSLSSPPFATLSTSPSGGLLSQMRPRVGSSHGAGFGGMFGRKDMGKGKAQGQGPVGMGEGALDILKRLEGAPGTGTSA